MITADAFWNGRDVLYAHALTPQIRANAQVTIDRANALLEIFYATETHEVARDAHSGWRPPEVNARVPNAAPNSNHMTGQAVDIADDDEALDNWLMTPAGQAALEKVGLWMEHPSATPRWTHVQIVPPHSGHRVFYP